MRKENLYYTRTRNPCTLKEVPDMGTEKERKDAQQAMLYELRRLLKNSGKETYTVKELCDLLDTIADAKAQE